MEPISDELRKRLKSEKGLIELMIARTYQIAFQEPFVALDGGAHRGFHSFRLARMGKCRGVHSFEASPAQHAEFTSLSEQLPLDVRSKITAHQAALVGDPSVSEIGFRESPSHPGRSGIKSIWLGDPDVSFNDEMRVPATTIDNLQLSVDFIKLDLEGGEFAALMGERSTLIASRPYVVFESAPPGRRTHNFSTQDVFDFAQSTDYTLLSPSGVELNPEGLEKYWCVWMAPKERTDRLQTCLVTVAEKAEKEGRKGVYSSNPI